LSADLLKLGKFMRQNTEHSRLRVWELFANACLCCICGNALTMILCALRRRTSCGHSEEFAAHEHGHATRRLHYTGHHGDVQLQQFTLSRRH